MSRFLADFISDATLRDAHARYPDRNRLASRHGNADLDTHDGELATDRHRTETVDTDPVRQSDHDADQHPDLDGRRPERGD